MIERIIRRIGTVLTVIVVFLIIYFSFSKPREGLAMTWLPLGDKGGHFIAYAAYGISCFMALFRMPKAETLTRQEGEMVRFSTWSSPVIIRTITSGSVLGVVIELLQPFVGRQRDILDAGANVMGLIVGVAIILLVIKTIGRMPWFWMNKEDEDNGLSKED